MENNTTTQATAASGTTYETTKLVTFIKSKAKDKVKFPQGNKDSLQVSIDLPSFELLDSVDDESVKIIARYGIETALRDIAHAEQSKATKAIEGADKPMVYGTSNESASGYYNALARAVTIEQIVDYLNVNSERKGGGGSGRMGIKTVVEFLENQAYDLIGLVEKYAGKDGDDAVMKKYKNLKLVFGKLSVNTDQVMKDFIVARVAETMELEHEGVTESYITMATKVCDWLLPKTSELEVGLEDL
jgi:hypothetical protein